MTGKGAIEIVFLPDCEEEYAVQTRCVCGRCQMKLTFHDGWQLLGVNAKLDSTTFADGLLQTIDSAISQARTGAAPQPAAPKTPPVQGKGAEAPPEAAEVRAERLLVEITEHDIIPPGLYRVNKPWEMSKGRSADGGADLLTQLGLCPETIPSVTLIRALGPAAPLSTN